MSFALYLIHFFIPQTDVPLSHTFTRRLTDNHNLRLYNVIHSIHILANIHMLLYYFLCSFIQRELTFTHFGVFFLNTFDKFFSTRRIN